MKLEYYNCPKPFGINTLKQPLPEPQFLSYKPDFDALKQLYEKYEKHENVVILAHGGSLTTFYGFYNSLKFKAQKNVYFLQTVDPDSISEIKHKTSPENTLVISISKSGETTTQMEMTMQFLNYPLLFITAKNSSLREVADRLKADVISHPPIGGRYTGLTEVALAPASIIGLDVKSLFIGAQEFYKQYTKDNLAWQAASIFFELENLGYVDVFMPFYSASLFSMSNLIVQLCHESFGKNGKGQTYFAHEAPESQHHTNQRFFGGRKNICGLFFASDSVQNDLTTVYPPALHSVQIKGHVLFDINKIPLKQSLKFELEGTLEDARIQAIPTAVLTIPGYSEQAIGSLVGFWQLYAVYASLLRQVDPFDQPQVENSKNISFSKRLQYRGIM